jgi:N-acetylneuraminate synthase
MKQGDLLTADHVKAIRPGLGLLPKHLEQVLGMRLVADAPRGTPLNWDLLKESA